MSIRKNDKNKGKTSKSPFSMKDGKRPAKPAKVKESPFKKFFKEKPDTSREDAYFSRDRRFRSTDKADGRTYESDRKPSDRNERPSFFGREGSREFKKESEFHPPAKFVKGRDRSENTDKPSFFSGKSFDNFERKERSYEKNDKPFEKREKSFDRKDKPFGRRDDFGSKSRSDFGKRSSSSDGSRKKLFDDNYFLGNTIGGGDSSNDRGENRPRDPRDSRPDFEPRRDFGPKREFGERRDSGDRDDRNKSDRPFAKKYDERDSGPRSFERKFDSKYNDSDGRKDFKSDFKSSKKSEESDEDGITRLNKFVAQSGLCSRRKAAELVKAGEVYVNGKVELNPAYETKPQDIITHKSIVLKKEEKLLYVLMNKPKNTITTAEDEKGRKTVLDLIGDRYPARLFPVGRLDRHTTGLLLLTNDGELAKKLSHPSHQVKKVYHVELDKNVKTSDLDLIKDGLTLDDGIAEVDAVDYIEGGKKNEVGIEIHSGKNRIVRRIFEHLGYEVVRLDRTFYGGLTKKDLPRGFTRELKEREVIMLKHFTNHRKKEES